MVKVDLSRCPSCGLPLDPPGPVGICPACLMALAVGARDVTDPETGAGSTGTAGDDRAGTPPQALTRIGPYRLVRLLGEGGMGLVYLAEQEQPIRRTVALKLIKLGMDTREVVARFEAERQTLALMDHPNIASVYDAGATVEGRPYFVMEYVSGVSITEYCDRQRLTTRQRVELFVEVCAAIQHAHQKGIIHRDLKPSNVLVAEQDGQPRAKVIDFGIAKAIDQRKVERSVFTQQGRLIGTPEYMSPEQADTGKVDIDTRTDIYAMGVILYELLVGELPFAADRLRDAGYTEMLRILREEEPPRPSSRLASFSSAPGDQAGRRRTTLPSLASEIRGDLDWITLKALEKDRTRRYSSVSEFAADLTRSLSNEPVAARPPSVRYRVQKFVRRNRLGVTAASVVSVAVVGGLLASLVLYGRAERERRIADAQRAEAEDQRREAAARRSEAEAQGARANAARSEAEAQKSATDRALAIAESSLYFNNIGLAAREWADGNIESVDRLLDEAPERLRNWEWRFLKSIAHTEEAVVRVAAAAGSLTRVAFSSDGSRIVAASLDGRETATGNFTTLNVRTHLETRRRQATFETLVFGVGGPPSRLSQDGRYLAAHGVAGGVRGLMLWDTEAGGAPEVLTAPGLTLLPLSPIFSPDGSRVLALAAPSPPNPPPAPGVVVAWDVRTRSFIGEITRGPNINQIQFGADGRRLALISMATTARSIRIVDSVTGAERSTIRLESNAQGSVSGVLAIRFNDAGDLTSYVLRLDQSLEHRAMDGKTLWSWSIAGRSLGAAALSPDGRSVIVAVDDRSLRALDVDSGEERMKLVGSLANATSVAVSPDGARVAAAEPDGTVRVWRLDVQSRAAAIGFVADASRRTTPFLSADGRRVLLRAAGTVRDPSTVYTSWDLASNRQEFSVVATGRIGAGDPAFSAGGQRILVPRMSYAAQRDGQIAGQYRLMVVESGTGRILRTLGPATPAGAEVAEPPTVNGLSLTSVGDISLSPSGDRAIVSAIESRTSGCRVDIWDVGAGTLIASSGLLPDISCTRTGFAPDGRQAVVTMRRQSSPRMILPGTTYRVYDAVTGRVLNDLHDPLRADAVAPVFNRSGVRLATAARGGIAIWDLERGAKAASIDSSFALSAIAFSPDGTRIAASGASGTVRIWDGASGRPAIALPDTVGARELRSWTVPGAVAGRERLSFTEDGRHLMLTIPTATPSGVRIDQKIWWAGTTTLRSVPGVPPLARASDLYFWLLASRRQAG